MHSLFCLSYLSILWALNKNYCVTCSRILPVSVFCVLQASGVTPLKCDKIYDTDIVVTFMENTIVNKNGKSVNTFQSYERMYSGTVFIETRCRYNMDWIIRTTWECRIDGHADSSTTCQSSTHEDRSSGILLTWLKTDDDDDDDEYLDFADEASATMA